MADSRVGVRAVRRKQNNQFLLALIEEEEEGLPELRDKPSVPAFTQLFLDKKNMMAWSEFIALPEEQQEQYLKELNRDDESDIDEDEEERFVSRDGLICLGSTIRTAYGQNSTTY